MRPLGQDDFLDAAYGVMAIANQPPRSIGDRQVNLFNDVAET